MISLHSSQNVFEDKLMKRIYFIFNAHAGRQPVKVVKSTIGGELAEIIDKFTKAGYEVTTHPTQCKGDATDSTIYATENGFDIIICSGGDGTLSECITGMMNSERKVPIGYIPSGTTNDFAKGLGTPQKSLDVCDWIIRGLETENYVYCDIGSLNDKYFTYVATFGAFTSVTYETSQTLKNLIGHMAYLMNGVTKITNIKTHKVEVQYLNQTIEDEFILIMITNSKEIGGMMPCNDFLLDDGVFEVTMIKKPANILQLQSIITSLLNGERNPDKEYIKHFKTNEIKVTSLNDTPIHWNVDGENGGEITTATIKNIRQAITFVVGPEGEVNFIEPSSLELLNLKTAPEKSL